MTKYEKKVILDALAAYRALEIMIRFVPEEKRSPEQNEIIKKAETAAALGEYWESILDEPSGTVLI